MKLKKIARRLSSALAVGTMVVSMLGMTAFAEDAPKNVTITKNLAKPENVFAPQTEFTFTIAPGTAVAAGNGSDAVYAGPEGGATLANDVIASTPKAEDIGKETVKVGTLDITIDSTKFTAPGIYRYVVSETAGSYEGISYTGEVKLFDVYVNSDKEVYAYTFVSSDDPKVKDTDPFVNEYGVGEAEKELNNLTISKAVDGNQGDKSKKFEFTITVTGQEGEQFYVTFTDNSEPVTLLSGVSQTITLSDGQSATIYGLSKTDSYTVEETDYTADGYTTKIDNVETREATGTIQQDKTLNFVNTKNANVATGLILNIAPYVLMVALAGILAFFFLRRRKSEF